MLYNKLCKFPPCEKYGKIMLCYGTVALRHGWVKSDEDESLAQKAVGHKSDNSFLSSLFHIILFIFMARC